MFRGIAREATPAVRATTMRAVKPTVRRMATEVTKEHVATPSAEELKRVMEFGKFVDNRLADSLKEIVFRLSQMEAKMVTKEAMDAALLRNTLGIIGMIGTVAVTGATLAYRGGFFDKDRPRDTHGHEEPRVVILPSESVRQVVPKAS